MQELDLVTIGFSKGKLMTEREQVLEKALSLSAADRAFVADALEQSLPHEGFATPEVAAAWAAEVQRRIEAFERGDIKAVDADVAIERMQQQVSASRQELK